jgi:short subunit dehydrogenase-like uncharacterized protein
MSTILLYGATGYTGQLIAQHAVTVGLRPILAARSREKLQPLAEQLGLESRVFDLRSPSAVRNGIAGSTVVLHAAGPFSATSRPMADACLASGVHYLDITGEVGVFEALAARDAEAKAAGIMLLPGAGFDVVPSDCLAAHVAQRLPDATRLRISIGGLGKVSRGTFKTMLESLGRGTLVRRGGRMAEAVPPPRATADFGSGPTPTIGVSWGDVSTAWHSTHIPDIEVHFQASRSLEKSAAMSRLQRRLMSIGFVQRMLKRRVERKMPPGPTSEQRARSRSVLIAEVWNAAGAHAVSRLETVEGYTLTAWTSVEIARRVAQGEAPIGYQTPATAYGKDLILQFDRTTRQDL